MFDKVFLQTLEKAGEEGVDGRSNMTFHRQTTHPLVDKKAPEMVPGWNHSNDEIRATDRAACYVLFDRSGEMVFRGRLTFDEVEHEVRELLRSRR